MGIFNRKKNTEQHSDSERLDENLRDDLSKAYDELMSGENNTEEETTDNQQSAVPAGDFEAELLKSKIRTFKEKKTQGALIEVMKMLEGRKFYLPSVSNMKEPLENVNGEVKLKKGAVLNPALLTSKDKKTYLPVFTDEKSMVQKSPSGIVIQYNISQCIGIVYNKKNPVTAIVINPFTENFIIGEELLKSVFKKIEDNNQTNTQN